MLKREKAEEVERGQRAEEIDGEEAAMKKGKEGGKEGRIKGKEEAAGRMKGKKEQDVGWQQGEKRQAPDSGGDEAVVQAECAGRGEEAAQAVEEKALAGERTANEGEEARAG